MASIRERNGRLIADFRYMGTRCRETTSLEDNAYNRRVLKKRLEQLEAEITLGTFEYEKYFPKSKKIDDFKEKRSQQIAVQTQVPLFKDFTALWFKQKQIEWRGSYQQKVAIARGLMTRPKVLILDEPTRGVDVGAKKEIYQLINQFKKEGLSIILVSSEMPEVIGMSDRILVMHEGHISGEFSAKEATQEALMAAAVGKNYGSVQELTA